jgi:hypothetical protein
LGIENLIEQGYSSYGLIGNIRIGDKLKQKIYSGKARGYC